MLLGVFWRVNSLIDLIWAKSTIKKFTKLLRWNRTWIQQFQQAKKGERSEVRTDVIRCFRHSRFFLFLTTLSTPLKGHSLQL